MLEIQEDIIQHLKLFFNDNEFFKGIKIVQSNLYNNLLNDEQITVKVSNEYEETRYTTFNGEEINTIAIQVNCYGKQKALNGIKKSAYYVSEKLADLVSKAFNKKLLNESNENIKDVRKVMSSEPLPLKEGSQLYVVVLRFQLLVEYDYQK